VNHGVTFLGCSTLGLLLVLPCCGRKTLSDYGTLSSSGKQKQSLQHGEMSANGSCICDLARKNNYVFVGLLRLNTSKLIF
jgi:hypothetical protein